MKILYTNGCSMTTGEELGGEHTDSDGFLTSIDLNHKRTHGWPYLVATELSMELFNDGKGGSSNDRIFRTTIQWFTDYIAHQDPKDLFVIIAWSDPNRTEYRVDDTWLGILPTSSHSAWERQHQKIKDIHKFHQENFLDESTDLIRTLQYMLSLQAILKENNIPYLFCNGLGSIVTMDKNLNAKTKNIRNCIDATNYIHYDKFNNMWFECNGLPRGPRLHPLEEGHQHWANLLLKFIERNKILC